MPRCDSPVSNHSAITANPSLNWWRESLRSELMRVDDQRPLRIAYTLEQCWHRVPGGTATAALAVARALASDESVDLVGVAGRHRAAPDAPWQPPIVVRRLPLARPLLYETWLRVGWPAVERATGPVDVCHSTALIPAATAAPSVVTVHDLAFRRWPERFSRHGAAVMGRALDVIRRRADLVLSPSLATTADLVDAGIDADRIVLVPLGVDTTAATDSEIGDVVERYGLPERFVLFVGTREPRKNLTRLIDACQMAGVDLVVAGAVGWGEGAEQTDGPGDGRGVGSLRYLGFVPDQHLAALYAAAAAMAYPSEWEGFGLPVLEAMAQGTPVVTSRAGATEEVAGGAAVLVDPLDTASIADGILTALEPDRAAALRISGLSRAAEMSWQSTAAATVKAYRRVVEQPPRRRSTRVRS
jgi:glycosyltransferase involved in cell wall biosynthesis